MNLKELPKPETLEQAIKTCINYMSDEDFDFVETNGAEAAHHGFGTALRNEWGLWGDTPLSRHFKTRFGLGHGDDMSGLILQGIDAAVKQVEFDPDAAAAHYIDFWRKQGIDPLTQERVA